MDKTTKDMLMRAAKQAIAYRDRVDMASPYPQASVEMLRQGFDIGLPENGRAIQDVLTDLVSAAEPGLIGSTSSSFHGWVIGGSHPAGVAADWLTSAWGQNGCIYQTSPAAAIAEEVTENWLLDLLDLPRNASIGFTTGATMASFICLAAARLEVLGRVGWDINEDGLFGAPEVSVFVSEEAHSSVFATLRYLGFGQRRLVRIAADNEGRIDCENLRHTLTETDGPKIIICQAGHINSGAMDDFRALAALRDEHGAWLHVDGAFGLWARATPDLAYLCDGVELADSWAVDGHKWLQVPYDSGFAIVRHPLPHQQAMAITASYLNQSETDGRDPSHYVPELSRRSRGFAAWAVIQALGRKGVARLVSEDCRNAARLAEALVGVSGINILHEVCLNQVTMTFGEAGDRGDAQTMAVLQHIHAAETWYIREATWKGRTVIRISFATRPQDEADVDALAGLIKQAWASVQTAVP